MTATHAKHVKIILNNFHKGKLGASQPWGGWGEGVGADDLLMCISYKNWYINIKIMHINVQKQKNKKLEIFSLIFILILKWINF